MKRQSLFSGKIKKNISKCCLLKFLPNMLSINLKCILYHMPIGKAQKSPAWFFSRRIIELYLIAEVLIDCADMQTGLPCEFEIAVDFILSPLIGRPTGILCFYHRPSVGFN